MNQSTITKRMPTYFVDGVQSVAVHNSVVRVEFTRLDSTGTPHEEIELMIPVKQITSLIDALVRIKAAHDY